MPPKPIILRPFGFFLTRLNMRSVGLGVDDVLPEFGWRLRVYVVPEILTGPSEVKNRALDMIDVIDESSEEDVEIIRLGVEETRSETVSGVSLFVSEPEIRAERVDETMLEPTPVLEEDIRDIAEEGFEELEKRVADIVKELGGGRETEVGEEPLPSFEPIETPPASRKRRTKVPAGRYNLPSV